MSEAWKRLDLGGAGLRQRPEVAHLRVAEDLDPLLVQVLGEAREDEAGLRLERDRDAQGLEGGEDDGAVIGQARQLEHRFGGSAG